LGRVLTEADEVSGAPSVAVLGHELWRTRFAGDPAILGREVRLGDTHATIVGVMPAGFRFPVDDQLWVPLPDLSREPGRDSLHVFGRLAPGVSLQEAQAEATTLIARTAAAFPALYANLTPQVLPYPASVFPFSPGFLARAGIWSINLFAALFLIVVCGNIALLMFARAATREKEIVVRNALGATRGRILSMLFLEALVLAVLALGLGLTAAHLLLQWLTGIMRTGAERWPYWFDGGLSPTTALYAGLLALLAAAIAGVIPGLKIMGRDLSDRMRQSSAGGGGLRMGGLWTGVIVAQIAATMLFTAVALVVQWQAAHIAAVDLGFPTQQFLSARLEMDPMKTEEAGSATRPSQQRYSATVQELQRRLTSEPLVANVTVAEQLPGMPSPLRSLEVDSVDGTEPASRRRVETPFVNLNFFTVFQMPLLAGRGFDGRDLPETAHTAVVNQAFVDHVLKGRNAIGRRIRYDASRESSGARAAAEPGPWLEIVGVVRDLVPQGTAPLNLDNPTKPRVYRPLRADSHPVFLAVQAKTAAETFAPTLRRIADEVNPTLRLHDLTTLDHAIGEDARFWKVFANVVLAGSAMTLLLSLAGIYAVMSFTVVRRTREIGVRVALGGPAARVTTEIFRRPFLQVAAGVALGWLLLGAIVFLRQRGLDAELMKPATLLLGYGIVMLGVCALACIGPILRALGSDRGTAGGRVAAVLEFILGRFSHATVASTMLTADAVGTTRAIFKPAPPRRA
jgi:putative ABC transport system permease protein